MGRPPTANEEWTAPASTELVRNEAADGGSPAVDPRAAEHGANRMALTLSFPLAFATLALTYWCVDIVSPALPEIQRSLGLSGTGAGLVFAAFFGGRLVANLPAAVLVDRAGPRQTALVGSLLLAMGSVL